jgi:hypothetical protein
MCGSEEVIQRATLASAIRSYGDHSATLVWLAGLLVGCGGSVAQPTDDTPAEEVPPLGAPLSTRCPKTGVDWMDVVSRLPGRWQAGAETTGRFTEVVAGLEGSWGTYAGGTDYVEGTSQWSTNEEGLIVETGAGPCGAGASCDRRFVQSGTLSVDDSQLVFYGLWPVDPCQIGVPGTYEGREAYENNNNTGGGLRSWSEISERLSLRSDGTWHWQYRQTNYATVNDLGTAFWSAEPRVQSGEDSGTYEVADDRVTFRRAESATGSAMWVHSPDGTPLTLQLVGRAVPKSSVPAYRRVDR